MPTYDYRCDANGRIVEVGHRMSEQLSNWGEICQAAGIPPGDTPLDSPVKKLATGGNVVHKSNMGSGAEPACGTGACCPPGVCGLQ